MTSHVKDLQVEPFDSSLEPPKIMREETPSQPPPRRGSTNTQAIPVHFLFTHKEVGRRAPDVSALQVEYKEEEEQSGERNERRDSMTRRGSVKQVSLTWQEEEDFRDISLVFP